MQNPSLIKKKNERINGKKLNRKREKERTKINIKL